MVSTRRQTKGLQNGDSPAPAEVKSLRNGTSHGEAVQDRPVKRRRTGRSSAVTASDIDESVLRSDAETDVATPAKSASVRVAIRTKELPQEEDITTVTNDTNDGSADAEIANKENEGDSTKKANARKSSSKSNGAQTLKPIPESKHRRFDSEEPEEVIKEDEEMDHTTASATNGNDGSTSDEDDDEAPEQVTTTSSNLVRGLPPLPSQKKSKPKKRRREEETQPTVAEPTEAPKISEAEAQAVTVETTAPSTEETISHSPPAPSTSSFMTALEYSSNTSAMISQPLPKPKPIKPAKPIKDLHIASKNLTIRHLDSFSTSPAVQAKRGSLPMKMNSVSRNMKDQLLRRGKVGASTPSKGFLVR